MIIGITGSFGSGKTTVANLFRKCGFRIINVDKLYHEDFYKNHPLRNKIKREFGTLNRDQIKKIVFNDSKKLKRLNDITHPIIIKKTVNEIKKIAKEFNKKGYNNKTPINKKFNNKNKSSKNGKKPGLKIAVDIPLLFEAKVENLFDQIIVVKAGKKTQISRILKKKKYSKKEIEQIIKSQMPLKQKIRKADFVVDNCGNIMETQKQVRKIIGYMKTGYFRVVK